RHRHARAWRLRVSRLECRWPRRGAAVALQYLLYGMRVAGRGSRSNSDYIGRCLGELLGTDRVSMPKLAPLPGQPQDADGPVFREAWEAQAFAMALALHE